MQRTQSYLLCYAAEEEEWGGPVASVPAQHTGFSIITMAINEEQSESMSCYCGGENDRVVELAAERPPIVNG